MNSPLVCREVGGSNPARFEEVGPACWPVELTFQAMVTWKTWIGRAKWLYIYMYYIYILYIYIYYYFKIQSDGSTVCVFFAFLVRVLEGRYTHVFSRLQMDYIRQPKNENSGTFGM